MEVSPVVPMPLLRSSSNLHALLHHQEEMVEATVHNKKPRQRITSLHSSSNLHVEAKPAHQMIQTPPPKPPSLEPEVIPGREWVDDQIARRISEPVLLALEKLLNRQEARFGVTMFVEMTDDDRPEIERLMTINYQFEEAALVKFNRLRGLVIPPPGELLQKMDPKSPRHIGNGGSGLRRVNSMAADRWTSSLAHPAITPAHQQRLHERHLQCLVNLTEPEQLRLSLLLSKQEQQHGCNMFEAMTETDEFEVDAQLQRGYRYEDIAYHLFQAKYAGGGGMDMSSFSQALSVVDHHNVNTAVSPPNMPIRQLSRVNSRVMSSDMYATSPSASYIMAPPGAQPHGGSNRPSPLNRSGQSFFGDLQHGHSAHAEPQQVQQQQAQQQYVANRRSPTSSLSRNEGGSRPVGMMPAPMTRSGESFYGDLQHGHAAHAVAAVPAAHSPLSRANSIVIKSGSASPVASADHHHQRPAPMNRSGESFYGDLQHGHSVHAAEQKQQVRGGRPSSLSRSPSSNEGNADQMMPAPLNRSGQSFYGDLQHGHSAHATDEQRPVLSRSNSVVLSPSPSGGFLSTSGSSSRPAPFNRSGESFYGDLEHGHSAHAAEQEQPQQKLPRPPAIITRSPRSLMIPDAQQSLSADDEAERQVPQPPQRVVVVLKKKSGSPTSGLPPTPRSASRSNSLMSMSDDLIQVQSQQSGEDVSFVGIASPRAYNLC